MPADTSDTARLRCVSNQPVTHAIIGANIAAVAPPTARPKVSWNASSDGARLASARLADNRTAPVMTTGRVPMRSDRLPHAMLAKAIAMKPSVIAPEMPVIDQPVSRAIARRNTGNENIAPIAMQPIRPPAATMTQRYRESGMGYLLVVMTILGNRVPPASRNARSTWIRRTTHREIDMRGTRNVELSLSADRLRPQRADRAVTARRIDRSVRPCHRAFPESGKSKSEIVGWTARSG